MEIEILNVIGIPDDNKIEVAYNDGFLNNADFYFPGCASYLEKMRSRVHIQTVIFGGASQSARIPLKKFDLVFNSICNPDIHHKSLEILEKFLSLTSAPIVNHPRYLNRTQRDTIYELFKEESEFVFPKTVSCTPRSRKDVISTIKLNDLHFPILFRPSTHGGEDLVKIDNMNDLEKLDRFCLDGRKYYITQFVDYKDEEGLYKKSRFLFIGDEIFPRHLIISTDWKIHADTRKELMYKRRFKDEERDFLEHPPIQIVEKLKRVKDKIGLDIFGLDVSINGEKIVIFEINACMRVRHKKQDRYLEKQVEKIEKAIIELLYRKITKKSPRNAI